MGLPRTRSPNLNRTDTTFPNADRQIWEIAVKGKGHRQVGEPWRSLETSGHVDQFDISEFGQQFSRRRQIRFWWSLGCIAQTPLRSQSFQPEVSSSSPPVGSDRAFFISF